MKTVELVISDVNREPTVRDNQILRLYDEVTFAVTGNIGSLSHLELSAGNVRMLIVKGFTDGVAVQTLNTQGLFCAMSHVYREGNRRFRIRAVDVFGKTMYLSEIPIWNAIDVPPAVSAVDGTDGVSPHISESGTWAVGETDTGVQAQGPQGLPGADGLDGRDGVNGKDGRDGIDGINGRDGTNGLDGADGKDGKDGVDGRDGLTPHIGENGNWFIGDTDTGIQAQGPAGTNGTNGMDGLDGVSPHIGENGNWFVGETDTGIPAQGPEGAPGKDGKDGADSSGGTGFVDEPVSGPAFVEDETTGGSSSGEYFVD